MRVLSCRSTTRHLPCFVAHEQAAGFCSDVNVGILDFGRLFSLGSSTFLLGKSRQSAPRVFGMQAIRANIIWLVYVSLAVGECIVGGRLPSARVSEICLHTFLIFDNYF